MKYCKACQQKLDRPGRALYCSDCVETRTMYKSIIVNARRTFSAKVKKRPTLLTLTRDQLCRWRKEVVLECFYCRISQKELKLVGMKSQTQKIVGVLGIDRLDSNKGYTVENIVPCCFTCNQVKSNRFSPKEMQIIGTAIKAVWEGRR